jgi:hypothetical protein
VQPEAAPFPDIPTNAPGILTEHEEIHGVSPIQDEPAQSNKERAMLAAENSGIKFGLVDTHKRHEVIELLDDDDEDILNDFIQDNVANKIERHDNEDLRKIMEDKDEDEEIEPISDGTRKSSRAKVPNRKYVNYELYVTVAEEDEFLLALATNREESDKRGADDTEMGDEALSTVAHYIMVHYAEKELIKKHKKKYKPKDGQYTLDAGLRKFGNEGKMAITKELHQFNTYNVFKPLEGNSLSNEEKKAHYHCSYSLKKRETGLQRHDRVQMGVFNRTILPKKRQHHLLLLWNQCLRLLPLLQERTGRW